MIFLLCFLVSNAFSDEVLVFNMSKLNASIHLLDHNKNMTCATALATAMTKRIHAMESVDGKDPRLCKIGYDMWSEIPCLLDQSEFCNGHSACLTDECGCGDSFVFYCGDNNGCISMDQVCNGEKDCSDGSDECVCADYVNCVEGFADKGFCKNADKRQCPMADDTKEVTREVLQFKHCFPFPIINGERVPNVGSIEQCLAECPNYTHHCNRIHWDDCTPLDCPGTYYDCNKKSNNTSVNDLTSTRLRLTKVCDGKPDCWNGADEEDCFNRFLCKDNNISIHFSKTCDLVKDCNDGSDECQSCSVSLLYSEKHLIGYAFLRYWIFFLTLFIILCNTLAFIEHYGAVKVTKTGQIDRLLCLQLSLYDVMMSFYLAIISIKTIQFHGSYCMHDSYWRTSRSCHFCGFIFSFSSHGSMLIAALMGLTRAYNIVYTFTDMSYSRWVCLCIGMNIANFLNSILPILPVCFVNVNDFFTVEWFFDENPFNPKATKEQLETVYMLYKNASTPSSVRRMLKELNKMTSRSIYDVSRRLGFYGRSPLCIQNLFSTEPKLVAIKCVYVFVILVIIAMVMISYAVILYVTKKRAVDVHVNAVEDAAAAERRTFLSFKVTLIIFTQMICWLPIILATFTTLLGQEIPPEVYEVAAIISLPINSLFNPICHSSVMKKIYQYVKMKLHILTQQHSIQNVQEEIAHGPERVIEDAI